MEIRDLGQKQEIESQNTSNTFRQVFMGPRSKEKILMICKAAVIKDYTNIIVAQSRNRFSCVGRS